MAVETCFFRYQTLVSIHLVSINSPVIFVQRIPLNKIKTCPMSMLLEIGSRIGDEGSWVHGMPTFVQQ